MAIQAQVGKVPGAPIKSFALESTATVRDALNKAGITAEGGFEVRVNGDTASMDTRLKDGDTVILARQIKGN